ncbi:peptidase T [Alkalibacterium pelagium]|uniref:Peptidase T n=1 Tax=Alkalibacterium pelagium TaxID=426702 RepID=A0A1H7L2S0_9LACT|nr:peptidase T [Alkalibacterium pelagium]GEN50716.1 peptidase T [Alkalibacterium pelagium]SEK92685.1 tripeptide aminopeptidase [Alkalibacterium pelagium]
MYNNLMDRFLTYVKIDTRSDADSISVPSTKKQVDFARVLMTDLKEIGMSDVEYNDANGFVTATLPANAEDTGPVIGFIAHMDTADFNSENIDPQIVENYDGETILLNEEQGIRLSPDDFPNLKNYIGQTLITTDGTTLLGSDDKSGIVEIMSMVEYFIANPTIKHGKIRVAFGPDEEIGVGADRFDVDHFGADFAYTIDGGPVGELEYESFNAAGAKIKIKGKNVHPGTAKDKMINALKLAVSFDQALPENEVPERTDGREGFFHLLEITGTVDEAMMQYIIRDHDREAFESKKEQMLAVASKLNEAFDEERVSVEMKDQYYNMREVIEKDMRPVELADKAMNNLGISPIVKPIRGGTDGSKISFMGLPTPNIFAGGENFHGRYEFVAVESMIKATDVLIEIAKLAAAE